MEIHVLKDEGRREEARSGETILANERADTCEQQAIDIDRGLIFVSVPL
jgi:hypothetical protein